MSQNAYLNVVKNNKSLSKKNNSNSLQKVCFQYTVEIYFIIWFM